MFEHTINAASLPPETAARFEAAKARRTGWERMWQECYQYALPQRDVFTGNSPGARLGEAIYDGTALDAVDQLAASLLGNLTPPWTQWFGFKAGPDLSPEQQEALAPRLEEIANTLQAHFDRSNFVVEMHQCLLDLVVAGTASLLFEESEPGGLSAFRFRAVPLNEIVLEEGTGGYLDGTFRRYALSARQLKERFAAADLPPEVLAAAAREPSRRFAVTESVLPEGIAYLYRAALEDSGTVLESAKLESSPFINFRWMKSPGEIYGRSPVMKALPDIKTANKVVELVLKNASIAVTGIWQADDDGVLNPANIELKPGSIIPKAVGSGGLKPLDMPGRFDISELVLSDLRARIRHALLADRMGQIADRRMTATEVLERSSEMALLMGANYGRLQAELLTPLVERAFAVLRRRGEVPDISLDGRTVMLEYRSPLARAQAQRNVRNTLSWIDNVMAMGPAAAEAIDLAETARFLGQALGVPGHLIKKELPPLPPQTQTQTQTQGSET